MPTDPALLSATELVQLYRAGKLSPVEAAEAALARIRKINGRFNAFCLVDEKSALASAKASEARWRERPAAGPAGRRAGVDQGPLLTKGWPTLRGSKTIDPQAAWNDDAPAVARLREHGAVLLGKTTTPEFGWKGVTDNPLTGITRNPWNPKMTPGRLLGRRGGRGRAAGMGAARRRHRRRRLDPHPGELHRPLRPQADLRPRAGLAALARSARSRTSGR